MTEEIKKVIEDYIAAYQAANGSRPIVTYKGGWFTVTVRGWIGSKHRKADLIMLTGNLRHRAESK
ncbi:hypothetical protein [Aquamicrobium zhengzhouense]|uniref:Uncharacterized protein n=1 Tax=Aquamicrobium zhengzhouense TaxID=2781738 RepID=A0ABS0S9R8_9HYPH|nr:hypothetical protein [Aquamicrobium zhengzhouense]MBI1620038.1 hypothetical protein [Aquamicrobium zhengzhouense]